MARVGLSAERVVVEAEALADEVGLASLSLSALAARLGVQPPSLYKHIAGQDALLSMIAARATSELSDVMRDAAVGQSGPDAVRDRAHPGRYSATLAAPDAADADAYAASTRAVAVLSDALAGYGLTGDDEIDAIRTLRSGLHGFVSLEAAGGFGLPVDVDRSFARLVDSLLSALER